MKKYIVTLFAVLTLCAVLCIAAPKAEAATVASGTCDENLTWTLDDKGTLVISGMGAMSYMDQTPWQSYRNRIKTVIITEGVTTIGMNAFYECRMLTSVTIPDSVTYIGPYAFCYCTGLRAVHTGNGVTNIADSAFANCSGLTAVTIGNSVTIIGGFAFQECSSMTSLTLGNSVDTICPGAFRYCTSLRSVSLPNSVTTIYGGVFENCTSLTSVTIPDSVTDIRGDAFRNCAGLIGIWVDQENKNYSSDSNGVLFNKNKTELIRAPGKLSGIYTVPDSVTDIGDEAFHSCTELTSVVMSNTVTTVGDYAFSGCTGLTSVILQDHVTFIGDGAFYNCSGLTELTIPSQVTYIGDATFLCCTGLTSVTLPEGVTYIGDDAFYYCESLTELKIPDGVTYIGQSAFWFCKALTSLTIPHGVTMIGWGMFRNCTDLTSVNIPVSVNYISDEAFGHCPALETVHYTGTAAQWTQVHIGSGNDDLKSAEKHHNVEIVDGCISGLFCPACDDYIEKTVGSHSYENGSCLVCGKADPNYVIEKVDIDVARMILGNALEFQFGVAQTKIPDKTGYYAVIEKTWADGTTTEKTIPASQWGTTGQYWALVYDGLAAKEMADEISVTVYNADGQAVSNAKTDSVRAYVERAFDGQTAKGKTMMVDMLNYGSAAQVHFNYGTDDLCNSKLTDVQKACGTTTLIPTANNQATGPNFKGTRLILESRIQMQVAFSGMTRDMYAVYSYTDHNGTQKNVTVKGEDFISVNGMYGIELSELVYADARSLVTVKVYNADGTLYSGAKDSVQSYVNRSGETDALFEALMKFADSAKAYLYANR